jgi:hypothetical protein
MFALLVPINQYHERRNRFWGNGVLAITQHEYVTSDLRNVNAPAPNQEIDFYVGRIAV